MGSCEAGSAPVAALGWPPCPEVNAAAEPPAAASQSSSYPHQPGPQASPAASNYSRKTKSTIRRTPASGSVSLVPSLSSTQEASLAVAGNALPGKGSQAQGEVAQCAGCQRPIRERYLLRALDQLWHEECLKCSCCHCLLGEVGSTLFTKGNLILCRRDYLRLYGSSGMCSACHKSIPAFEMVMRARGNVYHLECFACQQCNHRFCVGDRFYVQYGRILCEEDMYTAAEM